MDNSAKSTLSRIYESCYPWALGLVAILLFPGFPWIGKNAEIISLGFSKIFPSAITMGAIATGFLATSQSIFASLSGSRIVIKMKEQNHYARFLGFIDSAIQMSFLTVIFSGALSALDFSKVVAWHQYLMIIWAYICIAALATYFRCVRLLSEVLRANSDINPTIPREPFRPN